MGNRGAREISERQSMLLDLRFGLAPICVTPTPERVLPFLVEHTLLRGTEGPDLRALCFKGCHGAINQFISK
jgi:hypothetical protein